MTVSRTTSPAFDLKAITRPNIWVLEPYRCARDDYKTGVLLDANENAYGPAIFHDAMKESLSSGTSTLSYEILHGLNRYPDPHQEELKQIFCNVRNSEAPKSFGELVPLEPKNLYLGVGSDECIDTIIRCFAAPGKDKMLTCPPTYGMYSVSANVNDVEIVPVYLDLKTKGFPVRVNAVKEALAADPSINLVYFCSPGNPTASVVSLEAVEEILSYPSWNGIVVVDEAYIDFSPPGSSFAPLVTKYNNLIVLQTLSKAFGMAGIRLGICYSSPDIARVLNSVKAPYNISTLTSDFAMKAVSTEGLAHSRKNIDLILEQRNRLLKELPKIPGIGEFIGGNDANFLLVQILDKPNGVPSSPIALQLYTALAETKGVVIRYRGKEPGCIGALRITIGTEAENDILLAKIAEALEDIYAM
ncbi:pyridoxal phosphate-dependent transferase [Dipodascopsis uninucleata]